MLRNSIGAMITWMLPLLLSLGLYKPETKTYVPNYIGFKLIMVLAAMIVCYLTMRWISKKQLLSKSTPAIYLALNSALDLFLLVNIFAMPGVFWATTIFPIYLVIFLGVYFLTKRSQILQ